jgi:signal transduction histidine kinase
VRKQVVTTQLGTSLPLIRGDQTRLMQLLSNILGNAIKFTPDGGSISVTTKQILVERSSPLPGFDISGVPNTGTGQQQFIEIVISDTGIGIDSDDQRRIFDKFYEAGNIEEHSSGKVAFKSRGAGLGLSIAKGVIDMHGGQLWVESPGYDPQTCPGSSFIILLPIEPPQN